MVGFIAMRSAQRVNASDQRRARSQSPIHCARIRTGHGTKSRVPTRMDNKATQITRRTSLSDAVIRTALKAQLLADHDKDTVLLEELGLSRGHVRVDIALVNGRLHGYEIKSDLDSLRRLSRQVELYSK